MAFYCLVRVQKLLSFLILPARPLSLRQLAEETPANCVLAGSSANWRRVRGVSGGWRVYGQSLLSHPCRLLLLNLLTFVKRSFYNLGF